MMSAPVVDGTAYQKRIDSALGTRDPYQVLADTPRALAAIVKANAAAALRARPFAGKWTPNEILGHLADAEWAWGWRIRQVISQDRPTLTGYDQDDWVEAQAHNERDPQEHVDLFTAMRRSNVALWRRIPAPALDRIGMHVERGPEPLKLMLRMHAGHDLVHLDQIARYLQAIRP